MSARVIGVGHGASGDDAVGLSVAAYLRGSGVPHDVEVYEVSDAAALLDLLDTRLPVIVVDAVVSTDRPGEVVEVTLSELSAARQRFISTHGLDVASAVILARVLFGTEDVCVVGVAIAPEAVRGNALSPAIAGAVERAATAVLARLRSRLRAQT